MYKLSRIAILFVVMSLNFFPPAFAQTGRILWTKETVWGGVRVRQAGDIRRLLFLQENQETEESRMSVKAPHRPILKYVQQMVAATSLWETQSQEDPRAVRFLVVGLGGAGLTNALAHLYPEASITSIEIDPDVVEAARKFFFYKETERRVTVIEDARQFLGNDRSEYDVIYLDAFDGREVPETLRTVEFLSLLDQHLKPKGAVIANIHLVPEEASQRYRRSLMEVFPSGFLTLGLAQGVGMFGHQEFLGPATSIEQIERFQLPLDQLLQVRPPETLDGVAPFHDEPSSVKSSL